MSDESCGKDEDLARYRDLLASPPQAPFHEVDIERAGGTCEGRGDPSLPNEAQKSPVGRGACRRLSGSRMITSGNGTPCWDLIIRAIKRQPAENPGLPVLNDPE